MNRPNVAQGLAGVALVAAVLLPAACSKGEPASKAARGAVPVIEAPPKGAADGDAAARAATKEQLARQQEGRAFELNVLEPPPPKSAEPTPAPDEPQAPEPPPPKPPAKPPAARIAPAPEPPRPGFEAERQAPAMRDDDAARRAAPALESSPPRLLSRVAPEYPAEALRAGIDGGRVRARITLDAGGEVTNVEIVDAIPRRVFDRSVLRAVAQWRFSSGAPGRVIETEIEFRR